MRNDAISILKAFGILLMVMVHAGCPQFLHDFVLMFHMPLFFIASGYCFKDKYLHDNRTFIIKRIKGLYIPFIKWSLIFLALHNVFFYLNIYNDSYGFHGEVSYLYGWQDFVKNAAHIITRMTDNAQLLGGYWFLREMFFGTILSLFLMKYVHSVQWCLVVMLGLSIVSSQFNLHIPYFGIGTLTFLSAAFFIAGRVAHQYFSDENVKNINNWGGTSILLVGIVGLGSLLMPTNMLKYSTWQILPYFVFAVSGTWLFFNISSILVNRTSCWKKLMVFVGDNTMTILTWHFLCFKLVSLMIIVIYRLPIEKLAEFPVIEEYSNYYWILYFIIGSGLSLIVKFCLSRVKVQILKGVNCKKDKY